MYFKKWVKSIQIAGYNGTCTVYAYFKMWSSKVTALFTTKTASLVT